MTMPPESVLTEWLLISAGDARSAAEQAVAVARRAGQRVAHLHLQSLTPLPEDAVRQAAQGVRHVVVACQDADARAAAIARLLPALAVIPAGVSKEAVLKRLRNSPRCC
jgi:pyruvate/2-oxoacid:ferredoxin oxidoreductase alpha subunit